MKNYMNYRNHSTVRFVPNAQEPGSATEEGCVVTELKQQRWLLSVTADGLEDPFCSKFLAFMCTGLMEFCQGIDKNFWLTDAIYPEG
jgi:hypothetical protein